MSDDKVFPEGELPIDDVVCCDCSGVVTCFMIPDSVWDGLGLSPDAFACIECVGKRLNPNLKSEHVRHWVQKEMWRQRHKFGLAGKKSFASMKVHIPQLLAIPRGADGVTSVPKESSISRGKRPPPPPEKPDEDPVPG